MRLSNVQLTRTDTLIAKNKNIKQEQSASEPVTSRELNSSLWSTNPAQKFIFQPQLTRISFKSIIPFDNEDPSDFLPRNIDKLSCPCCGKPMLPLPLHEQFKQRIAESSPKEYMNILEEYEPYMLDIEQSVYNNLKSLSYKYPTMDIKELMQKLSTYRLKDLEKTQIKKLKEMQDVAITLKSREKSNTLQLINTAKDRIENICAKTFRRKEFIANVNALEIKNQMTKNLLIEIANSFPSSNENKNAWVVKCAGKDKQGNERPAKEIAEKFLMRSFANTDHLLAQDLGGEDRIPNYVAMHEGCNGAKTNKEFLEWFNEKPIERERNLKQYFAEVQEKIDNGTISDPRYKNYPQEGMETIKTITNGEVDLKADEADVVNI